MHATRTLLLLLLAAAAPAQMPEGVPVEHTLRIAPGAQVDLDTGFQLPAAKVKPYVADLCFDRDGEGFFLLPADAAQAAAGDAERPEADWSKERRRLGTRDSKPRTFFVRTDRGSIARVTLSIVDPYSTASAVLQWAVAPPALPVFLPGPTGLRARWEDKTLLVSWQGDAPRWLIEVEANGQTQKSTSSTPTLRIDDLDPAGTCRVRVRGLYANSEVSLPSEVVQCGRTRPPIRKTTGYPDRWYQGAGGLSLSRGEVAGEDAEVVFYLYGVYVPGGGVQHLGSGVDCWRASSTLPETGYLPSHGRLDADDVLAVHLPDGRYARLWLEPVEDGDLRQGMDVHFAFLPDGRRELLAAPANLRSERLGGAIVLQWDAVPGAGSYRVLEPGKQRPVEVNVTRLELGGLQADSFQVVQVAAVVPSGEESDPVPFEVPVFGPGYRLGTFQLDAGGKGGFDFATGAPSAGAAADLRITNSAGGASSLQFTSAGGIASGKDVPFGSFAAADRLSFGDRLDTDDRRRGDDLLFVRTAEGGIASVRITGRSYPNVEFRYVYRLPAGSKGR